MHSTAASGEYYAQIITYIYKVLNDLFIYLLS